MDTAFLDFGDYQKMGLKCGLEVHQQLRTRHKLFCRCPNTEYTDRYDAEILRHMRPTLSEMGEYDRTALMEYRTRKEILYRLNRDRICTYEIDDAPPFGLNPEALDIALEIAMLFQCNIVGEIHIARKQYLDGSIPTGFQRTMIVGLDGWFPLNDRRIRIRQLSLEEDACREVSDIGHRRTYYTDRLCIPLIEVVTEPDFRTPAEAYQGAERIRRITRVTGKVRRGPGSTRQDTNVSVSGGDRVEIKGVPSTQFIPHLMHWEGIRQKCLLQIAATLKRRGLTHEHFGDTWLDVTRVVQLTRFPPIREAAARGERVYAVRLPRFQDILEHRLGRDRRFVDELRDRVRVVACLDKMPNLLFSEDPEPNMAQRIWHRLASALAAESGDSIVLVWGPKRDAITACEEVVWRCRDALDGVQPDTRQVRSDGTTGFERVLAGPNRMYPDTDLPPVAITSQRLDRISSALPAYPWDRYDLFTTKYNLPHDAADALILDGNADTYLKVVEEIGTPPRLASHVLTNAYRRLQRRWQKPEQIPQPALLAYFKAYTDGRFTREMAYMVLAELALNPSEGIENALTKVPTPRTFSDKELDSAVHPLMDGSQTLLLARPKEKAIHIAMGVAMRKLVGQTPGARVMDSAKRWFQNREVAA